MEIGHIGHSILHSPNSSIRLNTVLHVPQASKSLISVNRLACDNNAFLEFYPNHFLIEEQGTKRTLLKGRCEGGLYPLKFRMSSNKQGFGVFKPSASLWHSRLGHASTSIVQQVLSRHKLPFIRDSNKHAVCDACQQGESHQSPYPRFTSVSASPVDLIFLMYGDPHLLWSGETIIM
jgi:hypothetical protein